MPNLPVAMQRIQKLRRISIPEDMMKALGWQIGDQVIIDNYNGKILISPLKTTIKPITERLQMRGD